MDPLPLDPGSYGGTYKLVGGEPCLDFVNTVSWPGTDREHDWLDRPANVTAWAVAAGVLDDAGRRRLDARPVPDADLSTVHRARHDLRAVLDPLAHGDAPPASAIETLNEWLKGAAAHRRIDSSTRHWTWVEPSTLPDLLAPVVWNAADVLTGADASRLGHCPACGWLFYDSTRNRSRRWCDMADCGSRDKALRYYHRTKS